MRSRIVRQDFRGLNNFVKAISDKRVVRVGVLGEKTGRADLAAAVPLNPKKEDTVQVLWDSKKAKAGVYKATTSDLSNADLGAIHEFGGGNSPARSWLRLPLTKKAAWIVAQAARGAKQLLAAGRMDEVLARMGISAEVSIIDAFETDGWGTWPPNAPSTIAKKGSSAPLIDTGQLKRSVMSKVAMPS